MRRVRYEPRGLLAVDPRAFGFLFAMEPEPEVVTRDGVAMVTVRGPLEHHEGWWGDSYEAIKCRVAEALESSPKAIMLSIDSPGGLVSGCVETAREIRAMTRAAGVPLYAYVDGLAASAAYALACAAEVIGIPETGAVGSIGVIDALVDLTAQDAMFGARVALVTSGARKADGNPHAAISEDAIAAAQGRVDALAESFFAWVAEARGVSADDVRKLEAAILIGGTAVSAQLADQVITLDGLLAIAGGAQANEGDGAMASKSYEDAIAALRKAAEGDDEEAKKAKRMLAAELAEEPPKKDEDEEEGKAEGDEEPPKKDEEEKAAASVSASTAGELASRLTTLERRLEGQERAEILAARPDLSPSLVKVLATKPVAEVKAIVNAIEKPKKPTLADKAATAVLDATRGVGAGGEADRSDRQRPEAAAAMDAAMGRTALKPAVKREGTKLYLGALAPAEPRRST